MNVAREQGWVALAIGGVALVIGLIVSRGDDEPADGLERFNANEARRRVEARELSPADRMEGVAGAPIYVPYRDLVPTPAFDVDVELTALLVRVDGLEMSNDELTARAQTVAAANPDATVMLRAHPDVEYGRIVDILQLLRKAGLTQISFKASP